MYDAFQRELHLNKDQDTDEDGNYTLEKVNCLGCCTLAPVVQIDELTYGHVDVEGATKVLKSFEHFTNNNGNGHKKSSLQKDTHQGEIRVGLGSCCVASGSEKVKDSLQLALIEKDLNVKLKSVGCVGMCHQVPLLEVIPQNGEATLYSKVKAEDVKTIVKKHFRPEGAWGKVKSTIYSLLEDLQSDKYWSGVDDYRIDAREKQVSAFLGKQVPIATEYRGIIDPLDISEYQQLGGFLSIKAVPERVQTTGGH